MLAGFISIALRMPLDLFRMALSRSATPILFKITGSLDFSPYALPQALLWPFDG
jgi:hypothetical protein